MSVLVADSLVGYPTASGHLEMLPLQGQTRWPEIHLLSGQCAALSSTDVSNFQIQCFGLDQRNRKHWMRPVRNAQIVVGAN